MVNRKIAIFALTLLAGFSFFETFTILVAIIKTITTVPMFLVFFLFLRLGAIFYFLMHNGQLLWFLLEDLLLKILAMMAPTTLTFLAFFEAATMIRLAFSFNTPAHNILFIYHVLQPRNEHNQRHDVETIH